MLVAATTYTHWIALGGSTRCSKGERLAVLTSHQAITI
jgi:hypothetical protein